MFSCAEAGDRSPELKRMVTDRTAVFPRDRTKVFGRGDTQVRALCGNQTEKTPSGPNSTTSALGRAAAAKQTLLCVIIGLT